MKQAKMIEDYRKDHPLCEACKVVKHADAVHHIRTRGAGGDNVPENLLSLCAEHHGEVHAMGLRRFITTHPDLADKVQKAMSRPKEGRMTCK